MVDAVGLDVGGAVVIVRANGGEDLVQDAQGVYPVQYQLHKLVLDVPHAFTMAILDILLDNVPGSPMQHSTRVEVRPNNEEDEVVDGHGLAF